MFDFISASSALVGGVIIGLASALLLVYHGRIAGVSGIVGGLVDRRDDWRWRAAFVGGLIAGGLALMWSLPSALPTELPRSIGTMAAAGLLVGVGTRVGNGCTSGHGICGIARLSRRSIVATLTFMVFGVLTVFTTQHLLGGAL